MTTSTNRLARERRGRSRPGRMLVPALVAGVVGALLVPVPATAAPAARTGAITTPKLDAAPAPKADGVQVGSGSYAPTPPAAVSGSGTDTATTLGTHQYIDPSQASKPVPTNQWWTDLVVDRFSGDLWANPFVLANSSAGTRLTIPQGWNADGTTMKQADPITVGGDVVPVAGGSDEMLADFESRIPAGWTATGNAFTGVSTDTNRGQEPVSGWQGVGYLSSFTNAAGDSATGTLTSSSFTVDRSHLTFMVGGGDSLTNEAVQLLVDGKVVESATGASSEVLKWADWDVSAYQGQTAQLRVVDGSTAGWAHVMLDDPMLTDDPTGVPARWTTTFSAKEDDALRWGDWNVSWREPQDGPGDQHIDVTASQGDPYTWFEYHGVAPKITVQDDASVTDGQGAAITFPFTGDRFEIDQDGRTFGVHAPENTTFTRTGDVIRATAGTPYLVFSDIPKTGLSLDDLQKTAFAIPRSTTMGYTYDPVAGKVEEHWSVDTDLLQGTDHDTIQGWLKHQYKDAANDLQFTGSTYDTPRGTMKTVVGHDGWTLDYAFSGITPIAGTPDMSSGDTAAVIHKYLSDYAAKKTYGADTYWGGKDLEQLAEYMTVAKQIGDTDDEQQLQATLEGALTDWYTYTDGETAHFFARYPTWGALIGFATSYGSGSMNDQHFHYGYFAVATALLGAVDPDWIKRYSGMATLVVKEYANWDRSDSDYPYLRTFGVWEGHSNAAGFSSPQGENQESSSEAIQSEAGLFLLGSVLGDKDMQATGAMEYVNERASVREYYQNASGNAASKTYDGDGTLPSAYPDQQVGILQDWGQAPATYFSDDPAWRAAIQWLPIAPEFDYLGWDPGLSGSIMNSMMKERPSVLGQQNTISDDSGDIQMLSKQWWGVGTSGGKPVSQDRTAAIGQLEAAIREAELNHPGYVTAKTADNPLYDPATGTLDVSTDSSGAVVFPSSIWTSANLPAALVPAKITGTEADTDPSRWTVPSPLLPYLSTDYTADTAKADSLYSVDLSHYTPGTDTAHAAAVFSTMGDALGNAVLGDLGEYDPKAFADIHDALWKAGDPAVTGQSMAGMTYWQSMSNLALGTEVTDRHTTDPLSQVFEDSSGRYSYVLDNTDTVQHSYDVYDGAQDIGSISVPAQTQITSHLDAQLAKVDVSTDGSPKTLVPGSSTSFTAVGHDQYGATTPLQGVQWSATAGTIDADGTYHATKEADSVTVTATAGGVSGSVRFRVAPAPVLTSIAVTPGFDRVVEGAPVDFDAAGRDQYGDPFALTDPVTWKYTGPGTIDGDGALTTTSAGSGYVVASSTGAEGTAVASSVASLPDAALHALITATSTNQDGDKAALMVDGDKTTRWESVWGEDDVDVTVDLGQETDIESVGIDWENAAAAQYDLQTADTLSGPWATVTSITKTDASADTDQVGGVARYVRLHLTSRQLQAYGYSIYGLHVYGTPAVGAITPTTVLVSPRTASVLPGATQKLTAYAFDAAGDGGRTDAAWSVDGGGSADPDGTFHAPSSGGTTSTVTAAVGGASGTAKLTTLAVVDPTPAPTPTPTPSPAAPDRNIAIGKPVTTSSNERGDLAGGNAVDGDGTTRWSSAAQEGEWISVDLGSVVPIDSVEIDWEAAYAKAYQLQVRSSTDDPWTTVAAVTNGNGGTDAHDLTGVSGRYVRMLGGTRSSSYGYSIYELKVLSTQGAPTPDLALHATTTSSSDESTSTPAGAATDGDPGSRWASGHTSGEWLQVDLGGVKALHSTELDWDKAYGSSYLIEGRSSATDDWTTLATVTGGTGGVDTERLSGSYRYVRFQGVKAATAYGYSLDSFEIR